jgi:undecaprenyl-diphosphatase
MGALEAFVLGVVEGITEYLPVSSTGHLVLFQRILGIPGSVEANGFAIAVQAGAIVAVLHLYRRRVGGLARGLVGRDRQGRRLLLALVAAFLPAALTGLLLEDWIHAHLFGLWPVVWAWLAGGVAILLVGRLRSPSAAPGGGLDVLTIGRGLAVGAAQVLALWPGTSRSLVTIVAGVLVGLGLPAAVEFSFLLGVLTLGAATVWEVFHVGGAMLEAYGAAPLAVGFCAALVSATLAVRWLVGWVSRRGLSVFGVYRVGIALLVAGLLLAGLL